MVSRADQRLETTMGHMLRIGVTLAAVVALIGGVLYLTQSHSAIPDYQHFQGATASFTSIAGIVAGSRRVDPRSVIELGILLLIATPICRVLLGVVGFSLRKTAFMPP
jgi:uncharacterized membrane protein